MDADQISFFKRGQHKCPVCCASFQKEDLITGNGRLNADKLTDELHRMFRPTEKFGQIYPLLYRIWACPSCYYSVFQEDFSNPQKKLLENLKAKAAMQLRREIVEQVFADIDLNGHRCLQDGIAAYIVAIYCYEYFGPDQAPTLKQGICALRAAWLAVYLHYDKPQENYDYLARILYRKASYFYRRAIELNDTQEEPLKHKSISNYGPDVDHNFGLDGAIYLASVLHYKYGQRSNRELRVKRLKEARIMISRLVGRGRASQGKPKVIIEHSRDLYHRITQEINAMTK